MSVEENGLDFSHKANQQIRELKGVINKLYQVIIRTLVVLKFLVRAGTVAYAYFFISTFVALFVAGFILVMMVLQLAVDRTRKVIHPDLKLSEWNIL